MSEKCKKYTAVTRWNKVRGEVEGLRVRWTGVQKRSERMKARWAGVRVGSEQEGVKGPKSEVGTPSVLHAQCETRSRP